jgi:hypothetical protein
MPALPPPASPGSLPRRAQHQVVGVETLGPFARDARHLGLPQARLDRSDDAQRDLVLQGKDIIDRAVVTLSPQMRPVRRVEKLSGNANAIAISAYTALEDIAHA